MQEEQFGFRPKHITSLQLACLLERVTRNIDERRLTGVMFLDFETAFDTVWVKGLLYKLIRLNFPSYLVNSISTYLSGRTIQTSFLTATFTLCVMRAGVAQCGIISSVPFSLYVDDVPAPSHHVELAFYADDTAIMATSLKSALLVKYLEAYLNDLEKWLTHWRISIHVPKGAAILFARAGRSFPLPLSVRLFGEQIKWVHQTRYLG